jgi:hypothetical protein
MLQKQELRSKLLNKMKQEDQRSHHFVQSKQHAATLVGFTFFKILS